MSLDSLIDDLAARVAEEINAVRGEIALAPPDGSAPGIVEFAATGEYEDPLDAVTDKVTSPALVHQILGSRVSAVGLTGDAQWLIGGPAPASVLPEATSSAKGIVKYGNASGTAAEGNDSRITGAAQKANNLSDLASASTARTNLGLGGAATLNVGTGSGTVAAGNDSRITGAMQGSNNLSDVSSIPTSRDNIQASSNRYGGAELATAATGSSGTVALDVSAASYFTLAPTGNVTGWTISNVPTSGRVCIITVEVIQGATPRSLVYPTGTTAMVAMPTQVANKRCVLTFSTRDGGSTWLGWAQIQP